MGEKLVGTVWGDVGMETTMCVRRVGQNHIIRCIYGIFGRKIIKYTVIYGVYIRFWPTLCVRNVSEWPFSRFCLSC